MELNHTLHQYHLAALAPFLAMNAQVAAVSPRGNHEEELALQALHAMKNVAPSSIHGLHIGGGAVRRYQAEGAWKVRVKVCGTRIKRSPRASSQKPKHASPDASSPMHILALPEIPYPKTTGTESTRKVSI